MLDALGVGSGLDITGIVDSLVEAERQPQLAVFDQKEDKLSAVMIGLSAMKANLSSLKGKSDTLSKTTTYQAKTVSVTDTTKVSASVTADAAIGSYKLGVAALAASQSLASGAYSTATSTVGTGTITISVGTPSYTGQNPNTYSSFINSSSIAQVEVSITEANNSLTGIRDAINASAAKVSASIVQDSSGYRLLLVSEETGVSNSVSLSVSNDGDSNNTDTGGLSALVYDSANANLTQYQAAADASFTINGLSVTSATNVVSDAIDGLSLDLRSVTSSDQLITISNDKASVVSAVEGFIDSYNTYVITANADTAYDATTGIAGVLQGDYTARSVMTQISNTISADLGELAIYRGLSDLGISVTVSGTLSFDKAKFETAFSADPSSVETALRGGTVGGRAVDGVMTTLNSLLNGFTQLQGVFDSRTDNLSAQIAVIDERRTELDQRMTALEARYMEQFKVMDSLVAQLETTGSFLESQLDALPGFVEDRSR